MPNKQGEITVVVKYNSKPKEDISELHITQHALQRFMERANIKDPEQALVELKILLAHVVRCFQCGESVLYRSDEDLWQIIAKRSYKQCEHCIITLYPLERIHAGSNHALASGSY